MLVQSARPPVVEIDPEGGGIYVRFTDRKVAKTLERLGREMIITVDVDRAGEIVGIEALCFDEFSLSQLLKAANVRADNIDFSKARFRTAARHVEEAVGI